MTEEQQNEAELPDRLSFTSVPALLTALLLSTLLLIGSLYGWYAIGPDIRGDITMFQAATLLFFMMLMIAIMLSLGYFRLWADDNGVTVRNGPLVRRYQIEQIAGLRLRSGDAWAYLLIKGDDGLEKRPVLAIQHMEGQGAKDKLKILRQWLKEHGATSKDVTADELS